MMTPEMITPSSDKSSEGARLAMRLWEPLSQPALTPRQMQDLRLAASKMTGAARRAFQAEMTLQYCRGSARLAATIVGWSREAGAGGGGGHRPGMLFGGGTSPRGGAQSACSGRTRWEEQAPAAAAARRQLAAAHAPPDQTFRTTLA